MKSPAYWNSAFYRFFVRYVWRKKKNQARNWAIVSQWVPHGVSVVEVAAGCGEFYEAALCGKVSSYVALDVNPAFVKAMTQKGIQAMRTDVLTAPVPVGDTVIMMSAFYHFKEHGDRVLTKLLNSAKRNVILVEPVNNPVDVHRWRDRLRAVLVSMGEGPIYERYMSDELLRLCERHATVLHHQLMHDNDYLVVLQGQALSAESEGIEKPFTATEKGGAGD